jgi:hypothetical protein
VTQDILDSGPFSSPWNFEIFQSVCSANAFKTCGFLLSPFPKSKNTRFFIFVGTIGTFRAQQGKMHFDLKRSTFTKNYALKKSKRLQLGTDGVANKIY